VVRVPDWWRARRRPQVSVSVGAREPSGLGLDALLDFSAKVTLEGEEVSEAELRALRSSAEGLALLKGRWVEVDREKLDQVLAHWEAVRVQAADGVSFAEGMRLLAGAEIGEAAGPDAVREWSGVQAGPWLSEVLAGLRDPGREGVEPGGSLRAELRPYQREGLRWLWLLCRLGLGACLADDMGLGKTVQVLALLLLLKERGAARDPHLLVLPASLLANWKAEAERFAPSLRLLVAHPSEVDPEALAARQAEALEGVDVVATSYGSLLRAPWMSGRRWGLVVLDEAQAIKNPATKQARAVEEALLPGAAGADGDAGGEPPDRPVVHLRLPQPRAAGVGEGLREVRAQARRRAPAARADAPVPAAPAEDGPLGDRRPAGEDRAAGVLRAEQAAGGAVPGVGGVAGAGPGAGPRHRAPRAGAGVPDAVQAALQPPVAVAGGRRLGARGEREGGPAPRAVRGGGLPAGEGAGVHPVPGDDRAPGDVAGGAVRAAGPGALRADEGEGAAGAGAAGSRRTSGSRSSCCRSRRAGPGST